MNSNETVTGNPVADESRAPATAAQVHLRLRGITKTFPNGVVANQGIDIDLNGGEVHAILGENGAGKSTLMKTLYGYHRPDAGVIELNGAPVEIHSPDRARELGIGMVFQSFMLIPSLSVVENVALGLPNGGFFLNTRDVARRIRETADRYGFAIDPWAMVWQISPGDQQKVEIVKLLLSDARVLIFDEPTSVLAPHEVDGLFQVFAKLRAAGYAVVFITHKMREVLATADRITVLRGGRVTGSIARSEATERGLVQMILGGEDTGEPSFRHTPPVAAPLVELSEAVADDDRGGQGLRRVSVGVAPGEIVGIAGVSGSGQRELGDVLLGLRKLRSGRLRFNGQDATRWSTGRLLEAGAACVPEDPLEMGVVREMSVLENLALGDRNAGSRPGWMPVDWASARAKLSGFIERFHLNMPRTDVPIGTLSGGNVQRVVFAREVSQQPKFFIAYYPSRGLDIAAVHAVHEVLRSLRDDGAAILFISEDLEELVALSDRIAVMYHGEIVATMRAVDADLQQIGLLMTGGASAGRTSAEDAVSTAAPLAQASA